MARDGNGNYNLPQAAFQTRTTVSSADVNNNFADIAAALSGSLSRDGQSTATGNLPMGGFRHTGVANATAWNEYAAVGQIQDQSFTHCGAAGGTADALVLSPSPPVTAYAAGQQFTFFSSGTNTGAVTVAVSGLTAQGIVLNGQELTAGQIENGHPYHILYDGSRFVLTRLSGLGDASIATEAMADSAVTTAKLADSAVTTAKISAASITTESLADNSVTAVKLVVAAVVTEALADGAVTTDKIADASIGFWQRVFTASGTFNKSDVPPWVRNVRVRVWGSGGGGGGGNATGSLQVRGAGGGGGGYACKIIAVSALGASETVTVPSGGAGGGAGGSGYAGGAASFGSHLSATGGSGGFFAGVPGALGGAGGVGSGGDINLAGSAGQHAAADYGPNVGTSMWGFGGSSPGEFGGQISTGNVGTHGRNYGGGGAGGNHVAGSRAGDGAGGLVVIDWLGG